MKSSMERKSEGRQRCVVEVDGRPSECSREEETGIGG